MTLTMISKLLSALSVFMFILCMLAPLKKSAAVQKISWLKALLKRHKTYAVLLLITALTHGIAAGKNPGMISGKTAWLITLLFVLFSFAGGKLKKELWLKIHRWLSVLLCLLVIIHIIAVII